MKPQKGPGATRLTHEAYAVALRMLADNHKVMPVVREIQKRFPEEHGPESTSPVSYHVIRGVWERRQDEIKALRKKLNDELDHLWITQKRQRLEALQEMFADANRWVPDKIIEPRSPGVTSVPTPSGGSVPSLVVYKKDTNTMLSVLKQAREEMGEDPESKKADSLSDLVRAAEEARGLQKTADLGHQEEEDVPYIEDARVVDVDPTYPSAGDDEERGFVDGRQIPDAAGRNSSSD